MYIGHLPEVGAAALTGVGVTLPVIMVISAFAALFSMGGASRASIMMGKQKKEAAGEYPGELYNGAGLHCPGSDGCIPGIRLPGSDDVRGQ